MRVNLDTGVIKMRLIYVTLSLTLLAACAPATSPASAPTDSPPIPSPALTPAAQVVAATLAASPTAQVVAATPAASPTAAPTDPAPQPSPTPALAPTAPALTTGACQNRYYPVAQGASWTYRLSGTVSDTFTRAIVAVRADGFDDQDTFNTGVTRRGGWACRRGDLISLTPNAGAFVATGETQTDFTVELNEGVTLPADPQPGATWTQKIVYSGQFNMGGMTVQGRSTLNASCEAIGTETVRVPAGSFEALRIDCTFKFDMAFLGNLAFNLSTTSSESIWYAQGVGMVKSRQTGEMGAAEIALLSYALP